MLTKQFVTKTYDTEDEAGIIDLLTQSFPEWKGRSNARDYWRWKYVDTPLGSNVSVALSEGKVIGVGHEINLKFKVGQGIYRSQYSDDYATHPEFRGMGVYNRLVDEITKKQEKTEFVLWLTKNPIVIKDSVKRRKTTTANFPYFLTHMFRIKNVQDFVESKSLKHKTFAKGGIAVYQNLNKLDHLLAKNEKNIKDIEIKEISKFGDDYRDFWGSIKDGYNFIPEKSPQFLNWRYLDRRAGNFVVKEARQNGVIKGFIVLETRKANEQIEGYIVDLLTATEEMEVRGALLDDACKYFDEQGVGVTHFQTIEGHDNQKIARRYGFIEPPGVFKLYIGCELLDELKEDRVKMESSKPTQLHFTYGGYF